MNIGANIKMLRKKSNMTQEELAEMLKVTVSAVSQWESGRTMPDISLLPVLSSVFSVTSDEILGIDIKENEDKIKELIALAREHSNNAEWKEALDILTDANKQYPSSFSITVHLAKALINYNSRKHINDYEQTIKLLNTVLEKCTDSMLRYEALDLLATAYSCAGNKEEMYKLFEQMTPFVYSKEFNMLYDFCELGENGIKQSKEYLSLLIGQLLVSLDLISMHFVDSKPIYTIEEKITIWKQIITIMDTLFPNGDYQLEAQTGEAVCIKLVNAYLKLNETDQAIYWLERACDFCIHFDTYDFEAEHTSPALKGHVDGGWIRENGQSSSFRLLNNLQKSDDLDKIKNDPRVQKILSKLNQIN